MINSFHNNLSYSLQFLFYNQYHLHSHRYFGKPLPSIIFVILLLNNGTKSSVVKSCFGISSPLKEKNIQFFGRHSHISQACIVKLLEKTNFF